VTPQANIVSRAMVWMQKEFACHTIIMYGSRARGGFRDDSDYDFVGIRRAGPRVRFERMLGSAFMDISIYPETHVLSPDPSMMYAMEGVVLVQEADWGTNFLRRIEMFYSQGPPSHTPDELEARRLWALKTLSRSRGLSSLSHYWRAKLILELLESYFHFRSLWWLGAKKSMAWLNEHDRDVYEAFDSALRPASSHEDLVRLVAIVCGEPGNSDGFPLTSRASGTPPHELHPVRRRQTAGAKRLPQPPDLRRASEPR
jgi:hypothetical protein